MDFKLQTKFKPAGGQPAAIRGLLGGFKKNQRWQTLLGVTGCGKTFCIANVIERLNKPTLVIAPNKILAAQLYREYKDFFPQNEVCYFVSYYDYYQPEAYLPITDTYIEKEAMINQEIDRLRHKATSALAVRKDVIIVASVSCIYNLGAPKNYLSAGLCLETNQSITRGDLVKQLVKIHFERGSLFLKRGVFRVRGDVFEIMPASAEITYRIDLKNQKVENIAIIDNLTRKITEKLKEIIIFPPKHFIVSAPQRKRAINDIKEEARERLKYFKENELLIEAERLERRIKYDLEMMRAIGFCHGIENYSRHLSGRLPGQPPDTLISYFPYNDSEPDFLTVIDESHLTIPQLSGMYKGDKSRKEVLIEHGWRLPSALDNRPLKFDEFKKQLGQVIFTTATPGLFEKKNSARLVEQIIRPTGLVDPQIIIRPVFDKLENYSQIDDLINEINQTISQKERVLVNALTKKMAEELSEFLNKKQISARYMHSETKTLERAGIIKDFRAGQFNVLVGVNLLREGLDLPEVSLVAILDADREGFLRNETSLIQTMGRAARNINGRVILYADYLTGSLKNAISEADRRRQIQIDYNKKHNIQPRSIKKEVVELIDTEKQ